MRTFRHNLLLKIHFCLTIQLQTYYYKVAILLVNISMFLRSQQSWFTKATSFWSLLSAVNGAALMLLHHISMFGTHSSQGLRQNFFTDTQTHRPTTITLPRLSSYMLWYTIPLVCSSSSQWFVHSLCSLHSFLYLDSLYHFFLFSSPLYYLTYM